MEKKYPIGDDAKLAILKKHYFDYYRPDFPSDKRATEVVNLALCIKEETEAIFKAMDEYAQQAATGAVWVKVEDNLPKRGETVLVEYRSGDYERMEYTGPEDWWKRNVKQWLDEATEQKLDA